MRNICRVATLLFFAGTGVSARGIFLEAGTVYQNSQSFFGSGDTASVNGRYFAANTSLGYEGKTWLAGVSTPFASRNASAEYYYADSNQKVTSSVTETGMGDPSVFGAHDIFGGNRYAPSVSITGSASAPIGKTALSLQTWQVRPGIAFDYPLSVFWFSLRTYTAIPFAAKEAVAGQYTAYAGAIFTTAVSLFQRFSTGMDISYAAGDFVRADASLRLGGFLSVSLAVEGLSFYFGGQTEVVRSDRDFFMQMSVRYRNLKL